MAELERGLAAILFTDVVGSTAITARSEADGIRIRDRHRHMVRTCVERYRGRFIEAPGDESLSVFDSALDAAHCALSLRETLEGDSELRLTMAIHLGETVYRGREVFGDGVNIAARVRALAEPEEILVSGEVAHAIRNHPDLGTSPRGEHKFKNVGRPVSVYALEGQAAAPRKKTDGRGSHRRWPRRLGLSLAGLLALALITRFVVPDLGLRLATAVVFEFGLIGPPADQKIASTTSADGTRIAWASFGSGPPIVQVRVFATSLELGPVPSAEQQAVLRDRHRYIYYDGRGFGLSRRNVAHSLEGRVADLEAVIDAAGLERTALWGISSGAQVAISYAARHPERVTRMVLYGASLHADHERGFDLETRNATIKLVRQHWGSDRKVFRDYFMETFIPDATPLQLRIFIEAVGRSASGQDVAEFLQSVAVADVREEAGRIRVPVLLTHRREDMLIPIEAGMEAARIIPDAQFLALEGQNHVFLPGEREGERAFEATLAFFDKDRSATISTAP